MAGGGWSKRGLGIPLEQRARAGVPAHASADGAAAACPARHCWVAGALDAEGVKRPGLLVEWRWREAGPQGGWEGRVLYCARLRADTWVTVEEWLPADLLTPL